jgi:hypothetical protein
LTSSIINHDYVAAKEEYISSEERLVPVPSAYCSILVPVAIKEKSKFIQIFDLCFLK